MRVHEPSATRWASMAVIVDFTIPGSTREQIYQAEDVARRRGEAAGRPPYPGCMFIAITEADDGARSVSAWRTEDDFREVLESTLGPDLASVGLLVGDIRVRPAVSMAIPGAHAH
jgi:hypothetical protein